MTEAKLVARTRRLDLEIDLIDLAGRSGLLWQRGRSGFAGRGTALAVPVAAGDPTASAEAAHAVMATIEVDDDLRLPGTGPVAIGALPFHPSLDGSLVVPRLLIGRSDDGTRWVTTVTSPDHPWFGREPHDVLDEVLADPDRDDGADDGPDAASFAITSPRPADDWCAALAAARDELRAGAAKKVVLAREVIVETDRPLRRTDVLRALRRSYPSCMVFGVDRFIGASPELLVARTGDLVRSHPMAGTAPRSADPTTDARLAANLLASAKDQVEHRYTIDMVHDTLLPWCSYLDEEAEPSIVAMANVQHLATLVEGRLSSPPASALELMRALHPTPAVNGSPRAAALDLIDRYEGIDRGRYAGPVGWVDGRGNGEWAVGIRSAEIEGTTARVFAGVGVVADSDPVLELAETRAKFQAVLNAVLRP
ncbi:MAG: isochorismate synthase [Acidimicrobiales bacterium]